MKLTARLALFAVATLIVAGVVATGADGSLDPVGNFNFIVEIEGLDECLVSSVEGIATETQIIEYRSGTDRSIRKIAGRHHVGNLVLRRGVTSDTNWWQWRKEIIDGEPDRRTVRIS